MNNRYGHMLLTLGLIIIFVVWINDLLATLVRVTEFGPIGYLVHLAIFAAVVAYAVYLKYLLGTAAGRLAVCRFVWQQLPCAMALVKPGRAAETFGDAELFRLCGMALGSLPDDGAVHRPVCVEEHIGPAGERVVERRIVPLTGFNSGHYTAELLVDITAQVKQARRRESEYVQMLKILVNMFEMKDPYSHGHSEAVSSLSHDLAKAMGLAPAAVDTITRAALLHDIGKIIIPPETLNKTEELSPAEYDQIMAHAAVGAGILASHDIFREEADIVCHHHERFDGRGYPAGLQGEGIPLGARVIAVADAFDAMTAGRSVRGRRDLATALDILTAEKGGQFDPIVVETLLRLAKAGPGKN